MIKIGLLAVYNVTVVGVFRKFSEKPKEVDIFLFYFIANLSFLGHIDPQVIGENLFTVIKTTTRT